jgi:hypothetical protein
LFRVITIDDGSVIKLPEPSGVGSLYVVASRRPTVPPPRVRSSRAETFSGRFYISSVLPRRKSVYLRDAVSGILAGILVCIINSPAVGGFL